MPPCVALLYPVKGTAAGAARAPASMGGRVAFCMRPGQPVYNATIAKEPSP